MNNYKFINIHTKNYISVITIDRTDFLNALSIDVLNELIDVLIYLQSDKKTGVIIITGAGEKAFIAGADIKYMQNLNEKNALEFGKLGQSLTLMIENSEKPVIAAINGFALGGGCELSLACHIRFASKNAIFGQPEVKLGLIPGWGGTQRLPRIVGKGHAVDLIISGNNINAQEAYRIGLVNKVFPLDILMASTIEYAKNILNNGPTSVSEALKCINGTYGKSIGGGLEQEVISFSKLFKNEETREGLSAFIEKRTPKFR